MLASIYGLFFCTLDKGNLAPKGKAFFSFTFMGKNSPKKYYHEVQEKVLEHIIKNHPDKIREIEYQSPVVISKNKLYPKEMGIRLLSNGYYMETKSPLARMMRNCRRWLKLIGVNNLSDVLTLNYLQAGC